MLNYYLSLIDNDYDRNKLDHLYRKYYSLMFSVAMKYVHNEETAKDIVHDAILKIIRHLNNIDTDNIFTTKSFLCIVVKSRAIDILRREKANSTCELEDVEFSLSDDSASPIEYIISNDGYEFLLKCINSLSDTYKPVCQLKYINGLKEAEIADLLELTPKNVNVRIFRGRQILKKMIKEKGGYGE